jgi:hypothetical protein
MTAPIVSEQQKALQSWVKPSEKRTATIAAKPIKPVKHGKKSST